jgi:chromosome segregation ATPase
VLAALTLTAYVAVGQLRAQRRTLADEVAQQETVNRQLTERVSETKRELEATEANLRTRGDALARLRRELAEEENTLKGVIAARDKALHDADAATRQLVEELAVARSDRQAADLGRAMYEGFWTSAKHDLDRAVLDRDQAQRERDAARGERDAVRGERDQLQKEHDRLRAERDSAQAEAGKLTAEIAVRSARIAELTRQLARAPNAATVAVPTDAAAAVPVDGGAAATSARTVAPK